MTGSIEYDRVSRRMHVLNVEFNGEGKTTAGNDGNCLARNHREAVRKIAGRMICSAENIAGKTV